MAVVQRMTYDMLLDLPEERRELLDGIVLMAASPAKKHQLVVKRLEAIFYQAEIAGFGEVWPAPFDVYFDPYNVTQPDLVFVAQQRLDIVHEDKIVGVPDLIVEVLSPGTAHIDRGRSPKGKRGTYEHFGVPSYWIIDPEAGVVAIFTLQQGHYPAEATQVHAGETITSPLFPSLPIDVGKLFR